MEFDKIIDVNNIPKNGVIVLKVSKIDDGLTASLQELGNQLKPFTSGKNISVFILKKGDSIELQSPEQMEKFGWYKKNTGDFHICIEKSTLLDSLVKEVKSGSKGAIADLTEILAARIVEDIAKKDIDIIIKK